MDVLINNAGISIYSTAVLFVWNRNGTWKLFRQAIDQVTPEVLVEGRSIFLPRLSPDGKHILYVNLHNPENPAQPASVMQVPLQGGSPRVVLRMPSMGNIQCARSSSKLCLFLTLEGSMAHFFSFNPEVGTTQEFTAIRVTEEPGWNLSPDGSQLALILSPRERKITFMSVDDKSTHEVELNPWALGSLDWAADSKSVFVTSRTANGASVILGVEPNGNHRVLLEGDSASQYWWVIPSPDGRYGALEAETGQNNIWMIEDFEIVLTNKKQARRWTRPRGRLAHSCTTSLPDLGKVYPVRLRGRRRYDISYFRMPIIRSKAPTDHPPEQNKATPEEATEVRQWLTRVAQATAEDLPAAADS